MWSHKIPARPHNTRQPKTAAEQHATAREHRPRGSWHGDARRRDAEQRCRSGHAAEQHATGREHRPLGSWHGDARRMDAERRCRSDTLTDKQGHEPPSDARAEGATNTADAAPGTKTPAAEKPNDRAALVTPTDK